ncbi:efflux RND transporter periplasmic adaptor subunit [Puniceibacterium sediminis]|uniref:RND family efflux transporter, MFP subunit n=1 Tax=Puniceibacterium sediminis TaxID=1608407 RepID=A0A238WM40_9RHOB|nr:efflux RND transporter periplasmic adaptor subunit [Puniceibacterium sediminis]SNR47451.1 RND family efflux transporter, MFP subunit [Puniceibacterium sediminis]
MKNTLFPVFLTLLTFSHPALADDAAKASAPRPVVTEIVTPQAGLSSIWVGSVAASSELDLGFLRLGTLAERNVDTGDIVKKGEVLARIDASDLESELRAAQAGVTIGEANLQTARDAFDRAQQLAIRGVGSEVTLETARNDLAAAEAAMEQARSAEARAEDARAYADLTAPMDGVITSVSAEPGATLSAGEAVMRLSSTDRREVIIALSEEDAAGMAPDAVFEIHLLSNPEVSAEATLARIDPVSARATRTRAAHLTLAEDASAGFRLGALVNATLEGGRGAITTLPVTALIENGELRTVWRVSKDDRVVSRVTVTTGPRAGGRVVILQGVGVGDEIVIRGVNSIEDGQTVGPRIAARQLPGADQ